MELSKQVTSLEISKRLKELGVKQESLFMWAEFYQLSDKKKGITRGAPKWQVINFPHYPKTGLEPSEWLELTGTQMLSAFTVAELGQILRDEESELPTYLSSTEEWVAVYETTLIGGASTEADARGAMLIYLLQNNLITI